ncbi:arrestin-related trafficking adapter 3/6, partial [Tremellales sp. Uapishka_1]
MGKSNQPLNIRLTEPVIFLRGPSTGMDFRGRPQTVRTDGPPAMLRGLLTLKLSKPSRIRSIVISLEGKARTEWPEGIGARRIDTSEEHVLLSESTTFFSALHASKSRSRSNRRATSLGPGASAGQWDLYDESVVEDEHSGGEDDLDGWVGITRGRGAVPRSASALPGTHDSSRWPRDGFSRRSSITRDDSARPSPLLGVTGVSARERGPSPAYTPHAGLSAPRPLGGSGLALASSPNPVLSPIASAANSRGTSDRDDSTSTTGARASAMGRDLSRETVDEEPRPVRPILDDRPDSTQNQNVRFADHTGEEEEGRSSADSGETMPADVPSPGPPATGRAASLRTLDSNFSSSTASLPTSSSSQQNESTHPISAAVQSISAASTPGNASPAFTASPLATPITELPTTASRPPSLLSAHRSSLSNGTNDVITPPSRPSSLLSVHRGSLGNGRPSPSPGNSTLDFRRPRVGSNSTITHDGPATSGFMARKPSKQGLRSMSGRSDSLDPEGRGRKSKGFSLSAALRGLSQDVKDSLNQRSSSKSRTRMSGRGRTDSFLSAEPMPEGAAQMARQHSHDMDRRSSNHADFVPPFGRGGAGAVAGRSRSREVRGSPVRDERSESRGRGRNSGMKALTGALGAHADDEDVHNWKEFRKGTYNYPISFPIPITAPPTIHAEFGSVVYRLKATVVRVGALTPNLQEEVEVTMVASPQEDDMEETENVVVERQWEDQMRYQITLGGKAFPIGGTIPVSIRLMPLMKVKIHRVTVALEEKTDYFAQERKVARHETPKRFTLLAVKQPLAKATEPLLPIFSDSPTAASESPLAPLAVQAAINNPTPGSMDIDGNVNDDTYATLLNPLGPWHLEKLLEVPDCARRIKFTSKHDQTNVTITHVLKVTLRVERGDDVAVDSKGKRKQFDIIIETPIKILDCRVNSNWNSLPTYSTVNPSSSSAQPGVCSLHGRTSASLRSHEPTPHYIPQVGHTAHAHGSLLPQPPVSHVTRDREVNEGDDSLLERNIVYDRLMSGQVTETGETPPTYVEAVASGSGSGSGNGEVRGRSAVRS